MSARQPIVATTFFLLLVVVSALLHEPASAQNRWPPWQSYGEAEDTARKKAAKRPSTNAAMLNRQIEQFKAAGKYAQAVPLAKQALALAERKGAASIEVADALDVLADLYTAQNQHAAAEPLLKRALAIREAAPGQPGIVASRERLAAAYDKQGKSDAANALRAAAGQSAADAARMAKAAAEQAKAEMARRAAEEQQRQAAAERSRADDRIAAQQNVGRQYMQRSAPPPPASPPIAAAPPPTDGDSDAAAPPPPPPAKPTATRVGDREPSPAAASPAPEAAAPKPGAGDLLGARGMARNRVGEVRSVVPPAADTTSKPGAAPSDAAEAIARDSAAAAPAPAAPAPATADPIGGGVPPASADWQVVPVYWGTDRAVQPNAQRLAFGSDRARRLQLGVAEITVPKVHEVPKVERPWVVKLPYFDVTIYAESEDPKRHFTVKQIKAMTREEMLATVKERLKASSTFKDQALVFIHGYNTSFDNALYRTAQIAYDLDFDGAPFLYSWPSGGAVASYTYDRESAQASEPYLRQFLEMVAKETGATQVSIIAHSMGNQPLMDVLRDLKSAAPEGVNISQVILAAPDVDADAFTNLARAFNGLAKNVTLYAAANDRALIVSRNFWGNYRAGDVPPSGPLVLPGIDTIDVTAASTDVFAINHSGYAANNRLLADIGELLKTGLRPPEMRALKPGKVTTQGGDYWRYLPAPEATSSTGP